MNLEILQLRTSSMANFSYLVYCPLSQRAVVIDPSQQTELLLQTAAEHRLSIELVINTHGHQDHIAGNPAVLAATGARWAAHPADLPQADIALADGMILPVGVGSLRVIHTPGHTPGGIVLRSADAVITGDTLFVTRCGRADFPGSDPAALYQSLQTLKQLPSTTRVFPGHDYGPQPSSTIGYELEHNAYLQCPDLESFLRLRMG